MNLKFWKPTNEKKLNNQIDYLTKENKKLKSNLSNKVLDFNFKYGLMDKLKVKYYKLIRRKKKLIIIYINDIKNVSIKHIFYDGINYFTINKKSYIFNEKDFYIYKNQPILFIYENKSKPISFSQSNQITSKEINNLINSNIIQTLLEPEMNIFGGLSKNMVTVAIGILVLIYLLSEGFFDTFLQLK